MRKQIDWTKYYVRKDLGFTKRYIQNGLEFDEQGYSIKDFPTEEERDERERQELSRMKMMPEKYAFSKSGQLFKTVNAAKSSAVKRRFDNVKFLEFNRGWVIELL